VRGGKGGGGGNVEEQEEGEDEACNTVPLLAVDLSARSIRWRKRRSREFHGDYHTRTILQFSLALSPRNNVFEPRIPRWVRARRKIGWTDDAITDALFVYNFIIDKLSFVEIFSNRSIFIHHEMKKSDDVKRAILSRVIVSLSMDFFIIYI